MQCRSKVLTHRPCRNSSRRHLLTPRNPLPLALCLRHSWSRNVTQRRPFQKSSRHTWRLGRYLGAGGCAGSACAWDRRRGLAWVMAADGLSALFRSAAMATSSEENSRNLARSRELSPAPTGCAENPPSARAIAATAVVIVFFILKFPLVPIDPGVGQFRRRWGCLERGSGRIGNISRTLSDSGGARAARSPRQSPSRPCPVGNASGDVPEDAVGGQCRSPEAGCASRTGPAFTFRDCMILNDAACACETGA